MGHQINIPVKCSHCGKSLMTEKVTLDGLPAIELEASMSGKLGKVYLSQIYGSYEKKFEGVEDVVGAIAAFSCPHCHQPFPVVQICECKAPMVGLQLEFGGMIKICSRNGCKRHALEFEDVNDAFTLFLRKDETGLG